MLLPPGKAVNASSAGMQRVIIAVSNQHAGTGTQGTTQPHQYVDTFETYVTAA